MLQGCIIRMAAFVNSLLESLGVVVVSGHPAQAPYRTYLAFLVDV